MTLSIQNLNFAWGGKPLFRNLSLDLPTNHFAAIIAPSGTGKSTLVKIMTGEVSSKKSCRVSDEIAYMPQNPLLLPHLSALENVISFSRAAKREVNIKEAKGLLNALGLNAAYDKKPSELSGGMQKRVALARTLFYKAPLIILDEPFSGVDKNQTEQIKNTLRALRQQRAFSLLCTLHNSSDALNFVDSAYEIHEGGLRCIF